MDRAENHPTARVTDWLGGGRRFRTCWVRHRHRGQREPRSSTFTVRLLALSPASGDIADRLLATVEGYAIAVGATSIVAILSDDIADRSDEYWNRVGSLFRHQLPRSEGVVMPHPGSSDVVPGAVLVNGKWRAISTFAPLGMLVVAGGTMEREGSRRRRNVADRGSSMVSAATRTVIETPMLKGLQDFTKALDESWGFSALARSFVSSYVPTLLNDLASFRDPYRRETRADGLLEEIGNAVKNRIPDAREGLDIRRTVFGDEMAQSPQASWDPTIAPVARELDDRMLQELIAHDVGVGWPRRKVEAGTLEDLQAYRRRARVVGRAIERQVRDLIRHPLYDSLTAEPKTDALEQAVAQGRRNTRYAVPENKTTCTPGRVSTAPPRCVHRSRSWEEVANTRPYTRSGLAIKAHQAADDERMRDARNYIETRICLPGAGPGHH